MKHIAIYLTALLALCTPELAFSQQRTASSEQPAAPAVNVSGKGILTVKTAAPSAPDGATAHLTITSPDAITVVGSAGMTIDLNGRYTVTAYTTAPARPRSPVTTLAIDLTNPTLTTE